MTIYERIRHFRKEVQGMTQEEFAKKINISRAAIASIETGRVSLTDRVVSDICNTFSLSETWLRTGEGSMYQETDTTLFAAFAKRYDLTENEQIVARYLLGLTSEERQAVLNHVLNLSAELLSAKAENRSLSLAPSIAETRPPDHKLTVEEKRAIVNAELDAEKEAETSALFISLSGTK